MIKSDGLSDWLKKRFHCHSFYTTGTRTVDSEGLQADLFTLATHDG